MRVGLLISLQLTSDLVVLPNVGLREFINYYQDM